MPFVEMFVPRGATTADQRETIGKAALAAARRAEGAPDNDKARSISWLRITEDDWIVGDEAVGPEEAPLYVIRANVPAGSLDDARRAQLVADITQAVAKADRDPERPFRESVAWVHIIEVPEGNWGARGKIQPLAAIRAFVSQT